MSTRRQVHTYTSRIHTPTHLSVHYNVLRLADSCGVVCLQQGLPRDLVQQPQCLRKHTHTHTHTHTHRHTSLSCSHSECITLCVFSEQAHGHALHAIAIESWSQLLILRRREVQHIAKAHMKTHLVVTPRCVMSPACLPHTPLAPVPFGWGHNTVPVSVLTYATAIEL